MDFNILKYNKINLLFFIFICIIACCLFLNWLMPAFDSMKEMDIIIQPPSEFERTLSINFYWVMLTIIAGYYAITSYNEINNKKELLPPIYKIFNIVIEGIKFIIGMAGAFLLYNSIPLIISSLGYNQKIPIFFVIASILFIINTFIFFIPATLNYLKTLNLKDFFEIKKILDYIKHNDEKYLSYIGFLILINIISSIIFSIFFVAFTISTIQADPQIDITTGNYQTFLSLYTQLIKNLVIIIHILLFTQLLMIPSLNKKAIGIKIPPKQKIKKAN